MVQRLITWNDILKLLMGWQFQTMDFLYPHFLFMNCINTLNFKHYVQNVTN